MRNWISEDRDAEVIADQADHAISEVEAMSKRGYVNEGQLVNASRSYLYNDSGVLKFYDASTGITKTVTVT